MPNQSTYESLEQREYMKRTAQVLANYREEHKRLKEINSELLDALTEAAAWARQVRHDFGNQHDMSFEPGLARDANKIAQIAEAAIAKSVQS